MAQPGDGVYIPQHGEAGAIKLAREALNRWQNTGCPDCRGDCGSANPPVNCCIMIETRDALAALDAIPQPDPVPADAEMDALDRQADLIRNMLHMGEKIAWGADTGVIDQQRAALSALRTRLAEVEGVLQAFADFDAMPVSVKRPDIFEGMVRRRIMATHHKLKEGK